MTPTPIYEVAPSQVTLKTVFTICFGVLAVIAIVFATWRSLLMVMVTSAAILLAVSLDHPIRFLQRYRMARWLAITIVIFGVLLLLVILGLLLVPAASEQVSQLFDRIPELKDSLQREPFVAKLLARTGLSHWIARPEGRLEVVQGAVSPLLGAVGLVLTFAGGCITVLFLTVFMLIFGNALIQAALGETLPERRATYVKLLGKIYRSLGGYLGGMLLICGLNAICATIFLALNDVPFYLPLGIVSGAASLVPYAGPVIVSTFIALLSSLGGVWHGVASVIFFGVYGQIEGNLIAPLVFKQTVHVNPLIVLLAVLFCGEIAGVAGAVAAVPAAAVLQIVLREILRHRREELQLPLRPSVPVS